MKLAVALLIGSLLFWTHLPATAQQLTMDSSTVDAIRNHLDISLEALNRASPNVLKAWNHINRALNLLPDGQPATVGYFNVSTPFVWNQSSGPMPIQIGAMLEHATPQPAYTGRVVVNMGGYGNVLELYDANMRLLPYFETTPFIGGGWQGYIKIATPTGLTQMVGLYAVDPSTNIGGGSLPFQWIVP